MLCLVFACYITAQNVNPREILLSHLTPGMHLKKCISDTTSTSILKSDYIYGIIVFDCIPNKTFLLVCNYYGNIKLVEL